VNGHLHLTCGIGHRGTSALLAQSFAAPLHLSKPHLDEASGHLVVNIVNPTAGLFDGDAIEIKVSVNSGAKLTLTTPSAARVYRARQDRPAVVSQVFYVAPNAVLESFPELFIPQGGARYHQKTVLHIEKGGTALFFEWLAPGRVACGETFAYHELRWDTDIFFGEQLIARERYSLRPDDHSLASLKTVHPASHYLGIFVCGLPEFPHEAVSLLASEAVHLGWGPLCVPDCWTIKVLARDNLTARAVMHQLRQILNNALGSPAADLRRY
jgi:urease accessory protein